MEPPGTHTVVFLKEKSGQVVWVEALLEMDVKSQAPPMNGLSALLRLIYPS